MEWSAARRQASMLGILVGRVGQGSFEVEVSERGVALDTVEQAVEQSRGYQRESVCVCV